MKYILLFCFLAVGQLSAQGVFDDSSLDYYQTVDEVNVKGEGGSDVESSRKIGEKEEDKYVKDSLRILLVKLMGLKKLDEKNLLITDVKENYSYYSELLEEFKESEIEPKDYIYLERTCAQIMNEKLQRNYNLSIGGNIILGLGLIGMLFFIYRRPQETDKEVTKLELSNQEMKVKNLILEGKSNKEIAETLFVSVSTVKSHVSNLYKKMGVSSRAELMNK